MAVELYDNFNRSSRDLDSDPCSGGQGTWYEVGYRSSPGIISGDAYARARSTYASFLDLDTPFEVGRAEVTVGPNSQNYQYSSLGIHYSDGSSQTYNCVYLPNTDGYLTLYERISGGMTLRGTGSTNIVSAGSKIAIECTVSGTVKAYTWDGSEWDEECSSSSFTTRTGDIVLDNNAGSTGYFDDLYGPSGGAPPAGASVMGVCVVG